MKKVIFIFSFFIIVHCSLFVGNCISQWTKCTSLQRDTIYSFTFGNDYIFTGSKNGVDRSSNNGLSWESVNSSIMIRRFLVWNNSSIYEAYCVYSILEPRCGIRHSTNNGTNWINDYSSWDEIKSFAASGPNIFCGFESGSSRNGGILYSTNYGSSWNYTGGLDVHSLAINGSYIFAGTLGNGVYLSTNNGTNWSQTALNNRTIRCLAVCGSDMYAGTDSQGVYLSVNNGTNWTQTALNNRTILSLAVNDSLVIAGTKSNGIYVSSNNGLTWIQKNEGFNSYPPINALLIANGYAFAGTNGQSVWRRPLAEIITGIQTENKTIPEDYYLSQNYPNPFNPSTIIKFAIPSSEGWMRNADGVGLVTLKVFDILGKEVTTLVNEKLQPGSYEVTFDGNNLPSGVYFYQLLTKDFSETKKLILLK